MSIPAKLKHEINHEHKSLEKICDDNTVNSDNQKKQLMNSDTELGRECPVLSAKCFSVYFHSVTKMQENEDEHGGSMAEN